MIDIKWIVPSPYEDCSDPEEHETRVILTGWYRGVIISKIKKLASSEDSYWAKYAGGEFCDDENGRSCCSHEKTFHSISEAQLWVKKGANQEENEINQWIDREIQWKLNREIREKHRFEFSLVEDFLKDLEKERGR